MNQVSLMGRLVRDPELNYTSAGKAYAKFTLAVDPQFKNTADGGKAEANFIPCVIWDKRAESLVQYCGKGKPILVSGALTTRKYADKDGQPRTSWEVNCREFHFVLKDSTQSQGGESDSSPDNSLKSEGYSDSRRRPSTPPPPSTDEIDPEDLYR